MHALQLAAIKVHEPIASIAISPVLFERTSPLMYNVTRPRPIASHTTVRIPCNRYTTLMIHIVVVATRTCDVQTMFLSLSINFPMYIRNDSSRQLFLFEIHLYRWSNSKKTALEKRVHRGAFMQAIAKR